MYRCVDILQVARRWFVTQDDINLYLLSRKKTYIVNGRKKYSKEIEYYRVLWASLSRTPKDRNTKHQLFINELICCQRSDHC